MRFEGLDLHRFVSLLTWALPCSLASAQGTVRDTAPTGISGVVITEVGRRPVDGAVVSLSEAQRTVTTSSTGAFRLTGVSPGTYTLSVRRIGFDPLDARITLEAHRVLDADLELATSSAQQLRGVTIRESSLVHGTMIGITARMRGGAGGAFLLRSQLDSASGTPVSELLRKTVRGVRIMTYPKTGAYLLASSRGVTSMNRIPKADPFDSSSPAACFSQVYVDGVRIYTPLGNNAAPDLSKYDAGILEAVEYYAGPATTPPEYSGDGASCGTLLLWTRAR